MERNFFLRALAWLGRHELAILLAIGSVAAGVWLFAALADEVMEGGTRKLDRTLLLTLRRPVDLQPLGPPGLLNAARDFTALGGPAVLTLLSVCASLFLYSMARNTWRYTSAGPLEADYWSATS